MRIPPPCWSFVRLDSPRSLAPRCRAIALAIAFSLLSLPAFSGGVRCTAPGIKGYSSEKAQAERYIGEPTSVLGAATFYLTVQGDSLYVHTNYKEFGAEYVTKLAADEPMDLETVVANIGGGFGGADLAARSASFIVSDKLLRSKKWSSALDFSDVHSLAVVKDGKAHQARSFRANGEEARWVLEYANGIYADAKDDQAPSLIETLRQQPLAKDDIQLLSFSLNRATVDRVKQVPNATNFNATSRDALSEELKKHTGKTLFALGHVEDSSFVTRNAAGKDVFHIGIEELEQLAQQCCQIRLFAVGCHSAQTVPRGMLETFNTLRVLDHYDHAFQTSTMLDFLQAMVGGDARLALVVDSALVQERITAEVRVIASEKAQQADAPIRGTEVARIWYSSLHPPPPVPAGATNTDGSNPPGTNTNPPIDGDGSSGMGCGCIAAVLAGIVVLSIIIVKRRDRPARRQNP